MQLSILLYIRCVLVVTYVTFYHLKLSHFSKVYVPSYSFHEDVAMISCLLNLNIFLFSCHTFVVFVPIYE